MIPKRGQKQIFFGICLMVGFLFLGNIKSTFAIDGIMNGKIATGEQDDYVFWLQTYDKASSPYYFDRFYVGKNGNIGIGTSSPNYMLDVNGAINGTAVLVNGVAVGSGGSQWVSGSGGIISYTGGNVGIAGTNPTAKLDIFGSLKNSSSVKFNAFGGAGDVLIMADNDGNIYSTSTAEFLGGSGGVNFWGGTKNANIWNGDAGLGNVGIGTTNPVAKLDVVSSGYGPIRQIRQAGGGSGPGYMTVGGVGGTLAVPTESLTYGGVFEGVGYRNSAFRSLGYMAVYGEGAATSGDGIKGSFRFFTTNSDSSSSEKIRINSEGNVGIGKTNQAVNLDVQGAINANSTVNGTGLCIAGDCRVSWASAVAAGGGNLWAGTTTGAIYSNNGTNNVGIGTTNPTVGHLEIRGTNPGQQIYSISTATSGTNYGVDGEAIGAGATANYGGFFTASGATNNFSLYTHNGTVALGINSGNVGVGMTNPSEAKLQIASAGATVPNIRLGAYSTGALSFINYQAGHLYNEIISGPNENLILSTSGTGNVGVGVTNPSALLQVGAGIKLNSDYTINWGNTASQGNLSWDTNKAIVRGLSGNSLSLGANGNFDQLFINTSGNVGIGKTNQAVNLDVIGAINANSTVNGTGLCIAGDCRVSWPSVVAAGGGNLWAGTTTGAIYSNNGTNNVGIGTTNPFSKLDVVLPTNGIALFKTSTGLASGNFAGIGLGYAEAGPLYVKSMIVQEQTGDAHARGRIHILNSNATGSANATLADARLTIQSDGNIGIGTTTPGYKLDVNGSIRSSYSNTNFAEGFRVLNTENNGDISIGAMGSIGYGISGWPNSGFIESTKGLVLDANTGDLILQTNRLTRLSVLNSGNVGIGTTAPGAKLHVAGTIRTNLSGSGSRCLYVDANGDISAKTTDCGTATGGDDLGNHTATANIKLNGFWLSNDGGNEGVFVKTDGTVGVGTSAPGAQFDVIGSINSNSTVNGTSLCIAGDCKTSWAAVASSSAGWTVNGTTVYKSNTSGMVGIGTTAPGTKFEIRDVTKTIPGNMSGDTQVNLALISSDAMAANIGGTLGFGGQYITPTNNDILFAAITGRKENANSGNADGYLSFNTWSGILGLNEKMRITSTGNVGIGTTNPTALFEILNTTAASASGQSTLRVDGVHSGGVFGSGPSIDFYHVSGGAISVLAGRIRSYSTGSALSGIAFDTGFSGPTTKMIIDNSGNVGIGKTNPAVNLDVIGAGNFSSTVNGTGLCIAGDCRVSWPSVVAAGGGNLWAGTTTGAIYSNNGTNNVGIGTTNPGEKLEISKGTSNVATRISDQSLVFSRSVDGQYVGGLVYDPTNQALNIKGGGGAGVIQFSNNGSEWARITSGGNVGIGTTTPTAKLQVENAGVVAININDSSSSQIPTINFQQGGATRASIEGGVSLAPRLDFSVVGFSRMMTLWNGNVGIGTTAPGAKLQVAGTIRTNLSGSGSRCLYVDANGDIGAKTVDCGTATGGDDLGNHTATQNLKLNGFWLSNDGGNEGVFVKTDGTVGVGTSAPGAQFDVIGSINSNSTVNGTSLCIAGDCKTSWAAVASSSAGWTVNGTTVYKSNTSGMVGIGTTAPGATLDVAGNQGSADNRNFKVTYPAGGGLANTELSGLTHLQTEGFGSFWTALYAKAGSANYAGVFNGLTVFMNGNVGVGVTNPGQHLAIEGSGNQELSIYSTDTGVVNTQKTFIKMFGENTSAAKVEQVRISSAPGTGASSAGQLMISTSDVDTTLKERLRINETGNVGIGKTNQAVNLDVLGAINANSTVNGTGLCIAGDCRVSWPSVVAAGGGNLWAGTTTGAIYSNNGTNNVGIGTTNPSRKLDINGTTNFGDAFYFAGGGSYVTWGTIDGATAVNLNAGSGYGLNFGTNGTTGRMVIQSGGNVGIGTTAPKNILHLGGQTSSIINFDTSQVGAALMGHNFYYNAGWKRPVADYVSAINFNNNQVGDIGFYTTGTGVADSAISWTIPFSIINSGAVSDTLVLKSGNVGIGTTAPGAKLQVAGTIRTNLSGSGSRCLYVDANGDIGAKTVDCGTATGGDDLGNHTATQNLKLNGFWLSNDGGNEGVFVKTDGTVGVGTSAPGAQFDVIGSINSNSTVNGTSLCIAGDCKTSWAAVASSSAGWTVNGTTVYKSNTAGNVGVGTTNPGEKLDVNGNIQLLNGGYLKGSTYSASKLTIDNDVTLAANRDVILAPTGSTNAFIVKQTSGNVGVGTTNPSSSKFQIYQGNSILESTTLTTTTRNNGYYTWTDKGFGMELGYGQTGQSSGWALNVFGRSTDTTAIRFGKYVASSALSTDFTELMTLLTNGNVGIGKTNPGINLDVIGGGNFTSTVNGTSLCIAGDCKTSWANAVGGPYLPLAGGTVTGVLYLQAPVELTSYIHMNNNDIDEVRNLIVTNKLTVPTIDPLYKINGTNYSTYAASISGGVKEEYMGKTKIEKEISVISKDRKYTTKEYETIINFAKIEEGSDLWVWRKVVDFSKENVEVAVTPYGNFAHVYYLIEDNKLIFRSDRPTEISYRLSGNRFDWKKWPTRATDQTEKPSFIIND